jgi:hypothetical protein
MKQIIPLLILLMLLGACSPGSNANVSPKPVKPESGDMPESPGEITGEVFSLGQNYILVVNGNNEGIVVPKFVNGNLLIDVYDEGAFSELNSLTGDSWKDKCGNYWNKLWPAVQKVKLLNNIANYPKADQLIQEIVPNDQGKFYYGIVTLDLVLPTDQDAHILVSSNSGSLPKLNSVRAVNYSDLRPSVLSRHHDFRSLTNVLMPYYEVLLPSSNMQAVTFCDLLMGNLTLKAQFEDQEIYIHVVESKGGFKPSLKSPKGN